MPFIMQNSEKDRETNGRWRESALEERRLSKEQVVYRIYVLEEEEGGGVISVLGIVKTRQYNQVYLVPEVINIETSEYKMLDREQWGSTWSETITMMKM